MSEVNLTCNGLTVQVDSRSGFDGGPCPVRGQGRLRGRPAHALMPDVIGVRTALLDPQNSHGPTRLFSMSEHAVLHARRRNLQGCNMGVLLKLGAGRPAPTPSEAESPSPGAWRTLSRTGLRERFVESSRFQNPVNSAPNVWCRLQVSTEEYILSSRGLVGPNR